MIPSRWFTEFSSRALSAEFTRLPMTAEIIDPATTHVTTTRRSLVERRAAFEKSGLVSAVLCPLYRLGIVRRRGGTRQR
jgi:hypothetical protein